MRQTVVGLAQSHISFSSASSGVMYAKCDCYEYVFMANPIKIVTTDFLEAVAAHSGRQVYVAVRDDTSHTATV